MKKLLLLSAFILILSNLSSQQVDVDVLGQIFPDRLEVIFNIPAGHHLTLQRDYFYIDIEPVPGLVFQDTEYPEGSIDEEGNIDYHGKVTLVRKFTATPEYTGEQEILLVYAGYQICLDTGACLFPQEVELNLPLPELSVAPPPAEQGGFWRTLQFLIMAFLGGLILNVMPCVLPVLSIKAMSIVKQSQQHHKDILKNSLAYTWGILVSFIILALIVVILKLSGESVGWGFQFQSPGFVMALLIVIFVFALSLFDVFIISVPGMTAATKASARGGLTGSFLSGIFAVLLATPCTAPLLGAALGFAFTQPYHMIFAIFILIGLGLAFPFIILGLWPKAIKAIPKPGEWMNIFKEVMGFLLLLTALYLIRSLYFLIGGLMLINVLLYLIILAFSVWLFGRFARPIYSKTRQWIFTIIALIIAIVAGFFILNFDQTGNPGTSQYGHDRPGWQTFSPELVSQYRNEGKPVFIDFGAEWCLTCKSNEATVLFTSDIEQAFRDNGVELLKGDFTRNDPVIGEWLLRFNRAGVPLYIFYYPGEEDPAVLPELITKEMIYNLLKKLNI